MAPINSCYLQCVISFTRLIKTLETPARDIADLIPLRGIKNEHVRFNVWAGSVGAKHPPHKRISLDYRLRDSNFYTVRVMDILQRLDSTLSIATQVISGERPLFENIRSKFDQQRDADSDRSSITSTSESSCSDEADILTPERQMAALYESIKNSVRRLYSLAIVIRQPVATDRLSRASRISVDHFVSFDQHHITECFPHTSPVLKKRLANAITRRRQLLVYNEQHYHKSSEPQASEELTDTGYLAQPGLQNKEPEQNLQRPRAVAECMDHPAKDTLSYAPTTSKGSILASTEATKFVTPIDVQSEIGTISTFGFTGADRETLQLPLRPQDDNGETLEQFLCPLCYHLIEVKGVRAWTRHVFRDLQAYVCTFDNCEAPDALFETRQDWIQHEFENHRREWHCNDPKHKSCGSETEFIDHMRGLHELHLPESQLLSVAKLCERPSSANTVICPLCTDGYHDVENGFERFKPSSIVRQASDHNFPKSLKNETSDIANLPEGTFTKDKDTLIKVTPWVASLPNAYETEGNLTPHAFEEPQQAHPTITQGGPSFIPSSDLKRHIGQHLERLALFAINKSKLMPDDGKSAHTEDAVARSKSSFESLQSLHSLNSDENQDNDQAEDTFTAEFDSTLSGVASVWNFLTTFSSTEVDKTKLNQFRNTVRHLLENSVISEAKFLPESEIKKLVTPAKIKLLLPNAKSELVDFIGRDAKKLFLTASLHHGNLHDIMSTFKYHGMTDENLPIRDLTSEDKYCDIHTEGLQRVCSHDKALEAFHRWDSHDVWTFYNDQWTFCAPILDMECSSQEFHAKHVLPFIEKGTTQKDGHFSTVCEAVIHPSHQTGRGSSKSNTDQTRVALKELKNLSEPNYNVHMSWLNEANALFQIAELRHKHLISQATAFKQGERRFIMLEWADGGTLRDIWQRESHDRSILDGNKVMRVLEELSGLASALSTLHGTNTRTETGKATSTDRIKDQAGSRSKTVFSQGQSNRNVNRLTVPKIRFEGISLDDENDSSDNAEEQYWRHGDLKPDNILHFKDENSPWLGTLKIADLGLAKQHAFATTQRQDPTRQKYTTSHYEAPEVITTMNSRVPRSRRYDIWSMGCIIFEYMIWLLYGYEEGLRSFYNEEKDINAHQETLYFTADLATREAQVSDAARSWISHILEVDPECNQATPSVIKDLIVLVRDKLLVVGLPKENMSQDDIKRCRASADDLERILKNIKRTAIDDEHKGGKYLSSGKSRNGVSPPRPQQVRRQSLLSTSSGSTSKQSNLDVGRLTAKRKSQQ